MIRITFLFVVFFNQVSFGQSLDFKNPETIEHEQRRAVYKKNRVKSLTLVSFKNLTDAAADTNGIITQILFFDTLGCIIISSKKVLGPGREITTIQKFDPSGNLLGSRQYLNEAFQAESRFYYDHENNLLSRVTIDSKGEMDSIVQKNKVKFQDGKKVTTNAKGAFAAKTIEEFDEENRIYKSTTFAQNGVSIQILEYKLNELGQMKEKRFLKSVSGKVYSYVYVYNASNFLIEIKIYNGNDMLTHVTKKEYNDQGLPMKETQWNFDKDVTDTVVHQYEFYGE